MKPTAYKLVCAALLALLLSPFSTAAEMTLDDALDALEGYQFGESRLYETVIQQAVREAGGDDNAAGALAAKIADALTDADSVDGKRFACRALGELGHPAAVPALAAHLDNDDMHDHAAWALRQIQADEATQALLKAVDRLQGRKKLDAIYSLGYKSGDDVRRKLVQVINAFPEDEELETALNALARVPELSTGTAFVSLYNRFPEDRKPLLINAMLDNAQLLIQVNLRDISNRLFRDAYADASITPVQKAAALYGVVKTDPGNSTELLAGVFVDEKDPELLRTAAKCIRMLVDPNTLDVFSKVMDTASDDVKLQILQALADRGEQVGELALKTATNADNIDLKLAAIAALGKAGNGDALTPLLDWAAEGNTDIGRAARAALSSFPASVDTELIAALDGADNKRGELLLRTLVERNATGIAPALLELATPAGHPHRDEIFRTLEALATPDLFEGILALLSTVDDAARRNVERVLVALGQKLDGASDALLATVDAANPEALRISGVKVIAGIGQMNAEQAYRGVLEGQLTAENDDIRAASIKALGEWPTREPLPALLAAAEKTTATATKDEIFDAVLSLLARSQVLVSPPPGSNDELIMTRRLSLAPEPLGPQEAFPILETIANNTANSSLRKKVLSALANVPLPEALALAQSYAARSTLRLEAHGAMLALATHLMGADREAATAALNTVLKDSEHELHKNQAQATLNLLPAVGDYIMAWRVSGPYAVGEGGDTMHFQDIMPTVLREPQPFVINFLATLGGFVRRAYIVTNLHAESAQDAILELGSDDGVTVWLNGKQVHDYPEGRELIPADDKIPVTLKAGDNILKIVVHQKASYWHVCARLTTPDGAPISGVTPKLPPPGEY